MSEQAMSADPEKKEKIKTLQKTLQEAVRLGRPCSPYALGNFASLPIN
jgi:hypothetical protein